MRRLLAFLERRHAALTRKYNTTHHRPAVTTRREKP